VRSVLILAAVGALSLAACSSSSSSSVPSPASTGAGGGGSGSTLSLTTADFAFSPTTLTANAGTVTLTVTNNGPSIHSFTLDDNSVSVDIPVGSSKTVTLNLTGSVGFHCHFHPATMKGTITVGGAEVTAPTSSSTGTTPRY
jgi:plastocyanin